MTTTTNTTRSELTAPTAVNGDAVIGDIKSQASALSAHAAGLVGSRVIALGIRHGLVDAAATLDEFTSEELAAESGTDPFYTAVWCRAAFAARVLETDDSGKYRLGPFIATLLLDKSSPTFVGGLFTIMEQPEIFDSFGRSLVSGEKTWWDQTTNDFIHAVADTGGAFNNRFIPDGMLKVPGVGVVAQFEGGTMVELACGTGYGLIRAAKAFPGMRFVGLDGDSYSLEIAESRIADAGLADRIELVQSTMEDFQADERYDLVTVNVSMHESRDIDAVTGAVFGALKPGGYFLNSDFAFPSTGDGLRTVPGRIMSGIQFFEAQIDDQLVSVDFYVELLRRHGFSEVGAVEISPIHAITHGRK
jgi:SAM-dependent methyltransferase